MTTAFWLGLAVLPAAALVFALAAWLLIAARKAWHSIHGHLLYNRVTLAADPRSVFNAPWRRDRIQGRAEEPTYEHAANRIRDALLQSPRLHVFIGLGWQIAIVRDYRDPDPADTTEGGNDR
jgi:hypothetical protein